MKTISKTLVAFALLTAVALEAKAQNLASGVTNVLMTGPLTNNTGNQSITFTNTQYQGVGNLFLVSSNIAGTNPRLGCILQGSWDNGTTFTNLLIAMTNSETLSFSQTNFNIVQLPPILRTTNIFSGTSPQFNYSVILQVPLRNKL
jgi:hypothetical protein